MHRRQDDRQAVPQNPESLPAQPAPRQKPQRRPLPVFKVILQQNDNVDLMLIVRTVMELTRLCRAEATHKMWEAHHCGRSLLLKTWKERAELYVEQFAGKGLLVTMEAI
jgi:ATP-dependent Clp protease adapter protein ClpS